MSKITHYVGWFDGPGLRGYCGHKHMDPEEAESCSAGGDGVRMTPLAVTEDGATYTLQVRQGECGPEYVSNELGVVIRM